jgi:flagellar biosynthesis protein FlhG
MHLDAFSGSVSSARKEQGASSRRRAAAAPNRRAVTIAVASGKGGVGKTNVAVNVGLCLRSRGLRVVLVDADLGLANADLVLGLTPRFNLSHLLARQRSWDEVVVQGPGGLGFVAGASGSPGLADLGMPDRQRLGEMFAAADCDVLLLDCAAGIHRGVTCFAQAAEVVIVVTTPEPPALTDAYATVKTLAREGYGGSVRLLVNMAESRFEANAVFARMHQVAQKFMNFPIADAGYLLHDSHVELAVRQRVPFVLRYPKCSAAACAAAVAARLANGKAVDKPPEGVFRRVVGLFS